MPLTLPEFLKPGKINVLAIETFAPTEKGSGHQLGGRLESLSADKDMGTLGRCRSVTTGAVTVRSPLAVHSLPRQHAQVRDLSVYAQLHNATDRTVKGWRPAQGRGPFSESVELSPHEDRTVVFTPELYPELRFTMPSVVP